MKSKRALFLASSIFTFTLILLPSAQAAIGSWSGLVGDTWSAAATNWSFTPAQIDPWDSINGPSNIALFNLASLAAPVSGTVFTNGITFNTNGIINAGGIITLAGTAPALSAASGVTGTLKSNLAGSGGFTKAGAGTIIINNVTANSLTGEVSVNAGQLVIQSSANAAAIATTATLRMTGGSLSLLGVTAPTTGVSVDTRSQTFGGTTISSGHSAISLNDNSSSLESSTPSSIILGAVTRNAGATLNLSYTGSATTLAGRAIGSSSWTVGGTILDSGVAYASYATGGSSATSPRSGDNWAASDASGNVILATYTASTAATLSGNANVAAGIDTTLAANTSVTSLRFAPTTARTITATGFNLTTGGILVSSTVGNFTQIITGGTLNSAATVANKDLVVIQNNTGNDLILASQITNSTSGATGLTKSGAGRLTVTSNANNYSGETRINEGTLRIGAGGSTGALPSSSAIINNGSLGFDRSAAFLQGIHLSNSISGTGSLSVLRTTTVTLNSSTNTFSGGVAIPTDGVLKISNGSALGSGTLTIGDATGNILTGRFEVTNNISASNPITFFGRSTSATDGIRSVSGNNTLTGTIALGTGGGLGYIQSETGSILTLGTTGSTAITTHSSAPSGRTVVLQGAGTGIVAGKIANLDGTKTMALTKNGSGTWTLSDANTYTGATNVNQGTLTVDTAGTLGAATGALAVGNNNTTADGTNTILNLSTSADTVKGSLSGAILLPTTGTNTATINNGGSGRNFTVNQTAAGTYAGVIAGAGHFTLGSGSTNTLTLTGANTYTGQTTISAGTLQIGSGPLAGSIAGSSAILNNGSLIFSSMDVQSVSQVISGTGSLTKAESGTLTLNGLNTYTGNTTVTDGTLVITNDDVLADTSTVSLPASSSLNLTHSGTDIVGTLIINGVTQPTGLYTFGTGKLQVGSASSPYADWAVAKGLDGTSGKDPAPGANPDNDSATNVAEFALNGNPLSGSDSGYSMGQTTNVPSVGDALIITFATRTGTTFTGATGSADGVTYTVQGTLDLTGFTAPVTEVTPAIVPGSWPAAGGGYEYHTFRLDASTGLTGKGFLRLFVQGAP